MEEEEAEAFRVLAKKQKESGNPSWSVSPVSLQPKRIEQNRCKDIFHKAVQDVKSETRHDKLSQYHEMKTSTSNTAH